MHAARGVPCRPFVKPTTSADPSARSAIPAAVLEAAEIPAAPAEDCSFAQLLNPEGVDVDFFVSHWWGHPFEQTLQARPRLTADLNPTRSPESPQIF